MYSNRLVSPSGEDLLEFSQEKAYLYEPVANWRDGAAYPQVVGKEESLKPEYCRRLAWELVRRTPRYRHDYRHLASAGLLSSRCFVTGESFYSWEQQPGPRARAMDVSVHACSSPPLQNETLGEFAVRHEGSRWWVQHAHDWACQHWCMSKLSAPEVAYSSPVFDDVPSLLGAERADYEPKKLEFVAGAHTVLAVLRLDASIPSQIARLKAQLERVSGEYKQNQPAKGANVKFREFAHFWLRTWDAFQAYRTEGLPIDTEAILSLFEHDAERLELIFADAGLDDRRSESIVQRLQKHFDGGAETLREFEKRMRTYLCIADSGFRALLFENPVLVSSSPQGTGVDLASGT